MYTPYIRPNTPRNTLNTPYIHPIYTPYIHPIYATVCIGRYEQQDAQELLSELINGLHEDVNRVKVKPSVPWPDSDGRSDEIVSNEYWQCNLQRENSIITSLFTGQFKTQISCKSCGRSSARFEPFTFLQVLSRPYVYVCMC